MKKLLGLGFLTIISVILLNSCNLVPYNQIIDKGKEAAAVRVESQAEKDLAELEKKYPGISKEGGFFDQANKILKEEIERGKQNLVKIESLEAGKKELSDRFSSTVNGLLGALGTAALSALGLWLRGKQWKAAFITTGQAIEKLPADVSTPVKEAISNNVENYGAKLASFVFSAIKTYVENKAK